MGESAMATTKEPGSFTWDDLRERPPEERILYYREYFSAYLGNLESGYIKEADWCLRVAENIALRSGMTRVEQRLAEQETRSLREHIKRYLDELPEEPEEVSKEGPFQTVH